jgi:hypothetical protein
MGANYECFFARHACPGRFMAVNSMKIIISNILFNYELTPNSEITIPTNFTGMPMGSVSFKKRVN